MKKTLIVLLAALLAAAAAVAADTAPDITTHPSCSYCGMDREKFSHSRVAIDYDDGTGAGLCSIHCAAVELAVNIDKTPKAILVGDYGTKALIDAEQAVWVIGGARPGVMTKRAKWAFAKKADAETFIKENGGALASFDEAMKASYEDMYGDTKMIREKRKMKRAMTEHREHSH
jgi:nitrous oxide reductase accessory protein NosL